MEIGEFVVCGRDLPAIQLEGRELLQSATDKFVARLTKWRTIARTGWGTGASEICRARRDLEEIKKDSRS